MATRVGIEGWGRSRWFTVVLAVLVLGACPCAFAEPEAAPEVARETGEAAEPSPYRWFMVVGFLAGAGFTAWRIRRGRNRRRRNHDGRDGGAR